MICPVCSKQCAESQICTQCGSDLKVHQMIEDLRTKGSTVAAPLSRPEFESATDRPSRPAAFQFSWLWVMVPAQISILTLVVALVIVAKPLKSLDYRPELKVPALVDGNSEQIRTFTLLLKDAVSLLTEQQKELADLRQRIKDEYTMGENVAGQQSKLQAKRRNSIKNQD